MTRLEKIEAVTNAYLFTNYGLHVNFDCENGFVETTLHWHHDDGSFCYDPFNPILTTEPQGSSITVDDLLTGLLNATQRSFKTLRGGTLPITAVKEVEAYLLEMKVVKTTEALIDM